MKFNAFQALIVAGLILGVVLVSGCTQSTNSQNNAATTPTTTGTVSNQNNTANSTSTESASTVNENNVDSNAASAASTSEENTNSNSTPPTVENTSIGITGFAFQPAALSVKVGTTVTWTNNDNASHTVTSNAGSELNSQTLSNGGTYSHTFTVPGSFSYHCAIHPSMQGSVTVEN